jgi:hypothetical protein
VLGLAFLTPLLDVDVEQGGERAALVATARVLEAPVPARTKAEVARLLVPVLREPTRDSLPDLRTELAARGAPELGAALDDDLRATVARSFRRSFLATAFLALLALVPLLRLPPARPRLRVARAPVAAALAAAAFVGGEAARGGFEYGSAPPTTPCAERDTVAGGGLERFAQRLALRTLDAVACRTGMSREELALAVANAGADATESVDRARERLRGATDAVREVLAGG